MKHLILFSVFVFSFAYGRAQIITTIAGSDGTVVGDNGPATAALLWAPYGVTVDRYGNMYIGDGYFNRVRKVNTAGIITTIAGTGTQGYNGDDIAATSAQVYRPFGVKCDTFGNVYFADAFNHRIRKVDVSTGIITTVAGTGVGGYNGDNIAATAAQLKTPYFIEIDKWGNMYVTEAENSRIRKIAPNGIITTIAGTGIEDYNGDNGPATDAAIARPYGIVASDNGDIYFADYYQHVVRKINSLGIITTVAGVGNAGFSGDNAAATAAWFNSPTGIALDEYNNLYICDGLNYRIRKVNLSTSIVTTIAGNGISGFSGDSGPATSAKISPPSGICINGSSLIFADFGNDRIRKISQVVAVKDVNISNCGVLSVYPNPSRGTFFVVLPSFEKDHTQLSVFNIVGQKVKEVSVVGDKQNEIRLDVPDGIYTITVNDGHNIYTSKLVVKKEY